MSLLPKSTGHYTALGKPAVLQPAAPIFAGEAPQRRGLFAARRVDPRQRLRRVRRIVRLGGRGPVSTAGNARERPPRLQLHQIAPPGARGRAADREAAVGRPGERPALAGAHEHHHDQDSEWNAHALGPRSRGEARLGNFCCLSACEPKVVLGGKRNQNLKLTCSAAVPARKSQTTFILPLALPLGNTTSRDLP